MASKSDLAYKALREDIISTTLLPDTPLRIQSLGVSTGFGSTPVREALRRLEAERFVVSEANFGFKVAPISIELLQDLEKGRLVIETALLEEAVVNGTDDWEAGIIAAHHQLKKAVLPVDTSDDDELNTWAHRHQKFHDALLSTATSQTLMEFNMLISEQLVRHYNFTMRGDRRKVFEVNEKVKEQLADALSLRHHTELMEAALDRDVTGSVTLLRAHVVLASTTFTKLFLDPRDTQS